MMRPLFSEGPWLLLLVQATTCLAVGLAASYVWRRRPARAHQVLLTALLVSILMPSLYLSAQYFGLGVLASKPAALDSVFALEGVSSPAEGGWATDVGLPDAEIASGPVPPIVEPGEEIPAPAAAAVRVPWGMIAAAGWSAASAILLLRLVLRFLLGWRVVRMAQPWDDEPMRRAIDTARRKLGVGRSIRIRRSGRVHSPVIWCWRREPVLLVQERISAAEDRADWTGVFCHEVSHWRRLDHLTGLFTEVLLAAFPWHPLLWWARDRLLWLSEQACDDWVLATGQNNADYAEMLLGLAAERQMAFVPTTIGKGNTMNLRIRRIITDRGSDPRIGRRWTFAVGVLAVGMTMGVAVAQPGPAGLEPKDAPPTTVVKERRGIIVRDSPEAEQQQVAMKRLLEQLMKQAGERKEVLREGNDLSDEERQIQQIELKLLVEQIEQMRNRFAGLDRAPAKIKSRDPLAPGREAEFGYAPRKDAEPGVKTQTFERELDRQVRDGREPEAREMKSRRETLQTERADAQKRLDGLKRAPANDFKRKKLEEFKIEKKPPVEPPRILKDGLKIEKKSSAEPPWIVKGPAGNPRLEAEVEDLRVQMKELHEQMRQMRKLLEQTVERGRPEKIER